MEVYTYAHFPPEWSIVHIALFSNVRNASQLRTRIVQASTMGGEEGDSEREAVNFAFIDARLITSKLHLLTAIHQSMLANASDALKTKTIHSEIVWSLNPTNNITEALRRFGVSDTSNSLFVVRVGPLSVNTVIEASMKHVVEGDLVPSSSLSNITDWTSIKKYYKLNTDPAVRALEKDLTSQNTKIDEIVSSLVAMKSVMS